MTKFILSLSLFLAALFRSLIDWHQAPPQQYTAAAMQAEFNAVGVPPQFQQQMLSIAWCESRFQPGAIGDNGEAFGLFQLHELWFVYFHVPDSLRLDPATNIATALKIANYEVARGYPPFSPWTCQ